jgi:hypothetical protein
MQLGLWGGSYRVLVKVAQGNLADVASQLEETPGAVMRPATSGRPCSFSVTGNFPHEPPRRVGSGTVRLGVCTSPPL